MAIYWNHIKGTGNATSNDSGLWTWIEWSKPEGITAIPATLTDALSPEIKVKIGNGSPDNATSLGNIITTNANITTHGNWIIDPLEGSSVGPAWEWRFDDSTKFKIQALDDGPVFNILDTLTWKYKLTDNRENYFTVHLEDEEGTKYNNILTVNSDQIGVDYPLYNKQILHTDDKCEALYFNATSDKRAKENITPATFSGLDLINKLSLYTFNYKNTAGTVPGILAQDLLTAQPEELDLVDNIAATGENGDYMSIKEGKLIFVLMQAIKEQQAQIDDLKAQIKNLTK